MTFKVPARTTRVIETDGGMNEARAPCFVAVPAPIPAVTAAAWAQPPANNAIYDVTAILRRLAIFFSLADMLDLTPLIFIEFSLS